MAQAVPTSASPLDRVVRSALPFHVGSGSTQGYLSRVFTDLSLPYGFEEVDALATGRSVAQAHEQEPSAEIPANGRTLREVLDAFVAADPRYVWRDVDGVVVIRPEAAWTDDGHPLHRPVPPVHLENVLPTSAVDAIGMATGHYKGPTGELAGSKRFSMDFPGGTIIELLNAVVRAHGELGWSLGRRHTGQDRADTSTVRPQLNLWSLLGMGVGMSGPLEPVLIPADSVLIRGDEYRVTRFGIHAAARPEWEPADPLDRRVPATDPVWLSSSTIRDFVRWFGVPFGLESVGAFDESVSPPYDLDAGPPQAVAPPGPRVDIGGLTLRAALDALVDANPDYSWRVVGGVVVIRPVAAWNDPSHPLAQPAPRVELARSHLGEALDTIARAFGREPAMPQAPFGDDSRPPLRLRGGSRFDLLNAAVVGRRHVYWTLVSSASPVPIGAGRAVDVSEPVVYLHGPSSGVAVRASPPAR